MTEINEDVQSPGSADLARTATEITDRESWLALRSRDLTASRIAALFDRHPFLSREQLAVQLRGGARRYDIGCTGRPFGDYSSSRGGGTNPGLGAFQRGPGNQLTLRGEP
jgi:hypothetical protein